MKNSKEWRIDIFNVEQFFFYLNEIKKQWDSYIKEHYVDSPNPNSIWYRGNTKVDYLMTPSLFRDFYQEKQVKEKIYGNVLNMQRSQFEEFRFRAESASEKPSGSQYSISDYIALMQHYTVHTNFLDWSENAIIGLYSALKNYCENIEDFKMFSKQADEIENKTETELLKEYISDRVKLKKVLNYKDNRRNVVFSMFCPALYNNYRKEKIADALNGIDKSFKYFEALKLNCCTIPNISWKNNENDLAMFLLGNKDFDKEFSDDELLSIVNNSDKFSLFLPLAVWTSRLNPRIKTQSGCFVAFSMYTPKTILQKEYVSNNGYTYDGKKKSWSLDMIQDIFCDGRDIDVPFMYNLILHKEVAEELAEIIVAMGIQETTMYPELDKIKIFFNS